MKAQEMANGVGDGNSPNLEINEDDEYDNEDDENNSPNPFYNPALHHEIASAQVHNDQISQMNNSQK